MRRAYSHTEFLRNVASSTAIETGADPDVVFAVMRARFSDIATPPSPRHPRDARMVFLESQSRRRHE